MLSRSNTNSTTIDLKKGTTIYSIAKLNDEHIGEYYLIVLGGYTNV